MSCDEITGCVKEDSGFAVMARVQVDGTNWTQAGVSAITWKAWDINDKSAAYTSGTLVVGVLLVMEGSDIGYGMLAGLPNWLETRS